MEGIFQPDILFGCLIAACGLQCLNMVSGIGLQSRAAIPPL
jgi:hypothetical protein